MFELQRFAEDSDNPYDYTRSSGEWIDLSCNEYCYVPAGMYYVHYPNDTQALAVDGSATYKISGVQSATGTSDTVTVTLKSTISNVTVYDSGKQPDYTRSYFYDFSHELSGGDKTELTVIVSGSYYGVNSSGKLFEKPQATPLSANAWYPRYSEQTTFGWLAAASTTQNEGYLDDGDTNVTIWATNLSAVSGNATAATATLAAGKAVSDVTVTGSAASTLTLTISGTDYYVNSSGKLYSLPDFGLMTKADKHRLNWLADNLNNFIVGAHTVSGGIAFTNIRGETVCTLETGTQ